MTNTTSTRGRMSRLLVAGAATAALAVGALAATAAPAFAAAAVSASQTQALAYDGQSISVSGTGYVAGTNLYVAVCDTAQPPGSACDLAKAAEVTVAAGGDFATPLFVRGAFGSTDCLGGTATCAIVTSNKDNPGDFGSYATKAISFSPVLKLSSSWLQPGDKVKLTGSHFPSAPTSLFVTVCAFPPGATNCDMTLAHIGQVAYDGSGGFTTEYTLGTSSFVSGAGTIDCAKVQCVIGTTNAAAPADPSYNSAAMFSIGSAPSKAKINKLKVKGNDNVLVKWKAAKANGAPVTGYTVQVKKAKKDWKKAGSTAAGKHKLVWKKGKDGKSYKFRVVAKSAAGNSKSKASKITI